MEALRKFPAVANRPALHVCLCVPAAGYVCPECESGTVVSHETRNVSINGIWRSPDRDNPPWNPDDLPEHLRGKGYRGADQDGYDGDEWVSPQEHHAGDLVELAKLELDAREI